jgi:hypothetical protein
MKKLQPRHYVYAFLVILIVGSFAILSLLWAHQQDEVTTLTSEVSSLTANQEASQGPTYYDVTVSPIDNAVYFPLAKLKVTSSTFAEGLVYTYTPSYTIPHDSKVFPAIISLSTHDLASNAQSTTQQFDCTEVAYADFVTPSYPINPMWKSDGSAKLADGRTMHVYYAPSIPGCSGAWRLNNVNAKATADLLKSASSY